ncbi:hypothetical protein BpHYR1_008729 [Brachionus plicatilis]|uniref:Uncharacterized protein n=1 Tax=Brachionus plicatilis TaxID=10195 RepID=A0A3M7SR36_BRAPC|nr:hypothetical protein BpHYR1_008729 [Brachionus plicatilis]
MIRTKWGKKKKKSFLVLLLVHSHTHTHTHRSAFKLNVFHGDKTKPFRARSEKSFEVVWQSVPCISCTIYEEAVFLLTRRHKLTPFKKKIFF